MGQQRAEDIGLPQEPGVTPGSSPSGFDEEPVNVLRLTYAELVNHLCPADGLKSTRHVHWATGRWLTYLGLGVDNQIGIELLVEFDAHLARLRDSKSRNKVSAKTAANLATELRKIRNAYLRLLHGGELPPSFAEAIQVGLVRLGKKSHDLRLDLCETAYHWALGNTTPKRNSSLPLIHRLEEYLGFAKNALAVRAHRKPVRVHDLSKDVPFRRYLAVVKTHPSRLLPALMPETLQADLNAWVEHKQKGEHFLSDGEVVFLEPRHRWSSIATVEIRLQSVYAYFGFLTRPKPTKPEVVMSWPERLDVGLGIPVKDLRFTMLVNRDHLYAYVRYCEVRSFDKAAFEHFETVRAGKIPASAKTPAKTISAACRDFIVAMNNLVNKPYSFLRLHPEFSKEAGVDPEEWGGWLKSRHKEILGVATVARNKTGENKRSNKEVISEMLRSDNPMQIIFDVLAQLRRDKPPATAPVWLACHARDVALISLLTFDPLRARNLSQLDIGRHLVPDRQTGRLAISISSHEFKNHIFGHAENRYRVLPVQVNQDMRNWLEVRSLVPGSDKTDAVFTCVAKQRRSTAERFDNHPDAARLKLPTLYNILDKYSRAYLGLSLGTHFFRTLLATTVARHGTPTQVKAILNDSEEIAMKVYRDVRNADEFKALDSIYDISRKGSPQ
jgi:hypothetical protein